MTETAKEKARQLRESYIKHAALAQIYRWWQYYDARAIGLSNCQDAHSLRASTIHLQVDGAITVAAEIEHLNMGIDPGGCVMKSTAYCNAVLRRTDALLPKITEIRITEGELQRADEFRPAYAENRIRSLVHYFTALVENPGRDPQPFRELLAEGFRLHYIDPPIDSFDALATWVAGPLSSVVASNHVVSDIDLEELGDGEYLATVGMRSEAMFPDGSGIASSNTQSWTVTDDKSERFARIRKITIRRDAVHRF